MSSNVGNTAGNNAGNDANNPYPPLLMSNNFNPFTVSPYSPLTANQGGDSHNPQVDTISPYTVTTIEILGNMNIADPYIFSIHGQQILPNQIQDGIVVVTANENSGITNSDFLVTMAGTNILEVLAQSATFQNYGPGDYTLNVIGQTNTLKLAVGPTISVPVGYVAYVEGNVLVNGTVTSSGTFDISGLQVDTLGVKTLLEVSGQTVLYGPVSALQGINVTGNAYISNNLDVSGNVDISGNAYIASNLDVSGNANITGNVYIANNLDVSGNINFINISVENARVTKFLGVSGEIDLSGVLQINYPFTNVNNNPVMYVNGKSIFYNDISMNGGQLFVDATLVGNKYSSIQPTLVINEDAPDNENANFEVLGLSNFIGSISIQDNLDISSGRIDVSNIVVKGYIDVSSGKIDVSGMYVKHNLDVSGHIDVSGLYVYHNLDISGNLSVGGTTIFSNASFQNLDVSGNLTVYNRADISGLYVYHNLDVSSGKIDVSGLYIKNNLDISGNLELSGNLIAYNSADISGLYVYHDLDVSGQIDTSGLYVYNNLDVSGNTNIQGITSYRIQVFDVDSAVTTITDISNQPTIYVVDCATAGVIIDLTTVSLIASSLKVGVTYYFIAKNTGAGTLQITYNSLDGPVTTAGVPAPLLTILVCVNYDGTDNFFSAST